MLYDEHGNLIPLTEEENTANLKKRDAIMHGFSDTQVSQMRIKAKHNLLWLAYSVLGYDLVGTKLHREYCGWLHGSDNIKFRCALLPRSHFKSVITTISDSIRIVLTDDAGTAPYPRNLGPNCRILIAHEVHDSAQVFLSSITDHFMNNPMLTGLFPELVPNERKQRINKSELELPRTKIWGEPTIDTVGVGGRRQGRHYNFIKLDDITGAEARDGEAKRKSTELWFDNIQSFLITPKTDHIDLIGTRWAFDDIYAHAFDFYEEQLIKYVRSCLEINPETNKLEPILPEHFSLDDIRILMKNKTVWNAQYANNPREGSVVFQPEWKRFYNWTSTNKFTYTIGNESYSHDVRELDRVILIDPAVSGLAGFIVTGTDSRNNIFTLDAQKKDWSPPELVDLIFQSVIRWQPRVVVIESVLFSALFQYWLVTEMQVRGIRFKVEPCTTKQKAKEVRVLGLTNYFKACQIFFNPEQKELIEEYDQFGATSNYHILDSMAQGPEFWRAPINQSIIDGWKKTEEQMLENRDMATGYSTID